MYFCLHSVKTKDQLELRCSRITQTNQQTQINHTIERWWFLCGFQLPMANARSTKFDPDARVVLSGGTAFENVGGRVSESAQGSWTHDWSYAEHLVFCPISTTVEFDAKLVCRHVMINSPNFDSV